MIKWFAKLIAPIIKFLGKIHWPGNRRRIGNAHAREAETLLIPGDVLLTKKRGELSNLFNPSSGYTHSGVYIGEVDGIPTVLEAIGKGNVGTDLYDFMLTKDCVEIKRNIYLNSSYSDVIKNIGKIFIESNTPYDYHFSLDNKSYYCFETCHVVLMRALGDSNMVALRAFGHRYYTAESFKSRDFKTIKRWGS